MIDTSVVVHMSVAFEGFNRSLRQAAKALGDLGRLFEDRNKWYAVNEGQWPDKYVLLNRFLRTGLRPPYIFND